MAGVLTKAEIKRVGKKLCIPPRGGKAGMRERTEGGDKGHREKDTGQKGREGGNNLLQGQGEGDTGGFLTFFIF